MIIRNITVSRNIGLLKDEFAQGILDKYLVSRNSLAGFFPLVFKKKPSTQAGNETDVYKLIQNIQLQMSIFLKEGSSFPVINSTFELLKTMKASLNASISSLNQWNYHSLPNIQARSELRTEMRQEIQRYNDRILERIITYVLPLQLAQEKPEGVYSKHIGSLKHHSSKVVPEVFEKHLGSYSASVSEDRLILNVQTLNLERLNLNQRIKRSENRGEQVLEPISEAICSVPDKESTWRISTQQQPLIRHRLNKIFNNLVDAITPVLKMHERLEEIFNRQIDSLKFPVKKISVFQRQSLLHIVKGYENRGGYNYNVLKQTSVLLKELVKRGFIDVNDLSKEILQVLSETTREELLEWKSRISQISRPFGEVVREKLTPEVEELYKVQEYYRRQTLFEADTTDEILTLKSMRIQQKESVLRLKEINDQIKVNIILEQSLMAKEIIKADIKNSTENEIISIFNRESFLNISLLEKPEIRENTDRILNRIITSILPLHMAHQKSERIFAKNIESRQYHTSKLVSKLLEKYLSSYMANVSEEGLNFNVQTLNIEHMNLSQRREHRENKEVFVRFMQEKTEIFLKELVRKGLVDVKYISEETVKHLNEEARENLLRNRLNKTSDNLLAEILKTEDILSKESELIFKQILSLKSSSLIKESNREITTHIEKEMRSGIVSVRLREILDQIKVNKILEQSLLSKEIIKTNIKNSTDNEIISIFNRESSLNIRLQEKSEIRENQDRILNRIITSILPLHMAHQKSERIFAKNIESRKYHTSKFVSKLLETYLDTYAANVSEEDLSFNVQTLNIEHMNLSQREEHRENKELSVRLIKEKAEVFLKELVRRGLVDVKHISKEILEHLSEETRINLLRNRLNITSDNFFAEILKTVDILPKESELIFKPILSLKSGRLIKEPDSETTAHIEKEIGNGIVSVRLKEILDQIKVNIILEQSLMAKEIIKADIRNSTENEIISTFNRESFLNISLLEKPKIRENTDRILNRIITSILPLHMVQQKSERIFAKNIESRKYHTSKFVSKLLETYLDTYAANVSEEGLSFNVQTLNIEHMNLSQREEHRENKELSVRLIKEKTEVFLKELVRRGLVDVKHISKEMVEHLSEETRVNLLRNRLNITSDNFFAEILKTVDILPKESELVFKPILSLKSSRLIKEPHREITTHIEKEMGSGIVSVRLKEILDQIKVTKVIEQVLTWKETMAARHELIAADEILLSFVTKDYINISLKENLRIQENTDRILKRMIKTRIPFDQVMEKVEGNYTRNISQIKEVLQLRISDEIKEELSSMNDSKYIKNAYLWKSERENIARSKKEVVEKSSEISARLIETFNRIKINEVLTKIFELRDNKAIREEMVQDPIVYATRSTLYKENTWSISTQQSLMRQLTQRVPIRTELKDIITEKSGIQSLWIEKASKKSTKEADEKDKIYRFDIRPMQDRLREIIDRITLSSVLEQILTEKLVKAAKYEYIASNHAMNTFGKVDSLNKNTLKMSEVLQRIDKTSERIFHSLRHVTQIGRGYQGDETAFEFNPLSLSEKKVINIYGSTAFMDVKKIHPTVSVEKPDSRDTVNKQDNIVNRTENVRVDIQNKEISSVEFNRIIEKVITEVEKRTKFERQKKGLR